MRILFACTRGAGHFNPAVPFVDACLRAGNEALVVGPPPLAETAERAGYGFRAGAVPPEEEMGPVWGRVPSLGFEEAERLVIGEIFATLNVRAMLPAMRAVVEEWRPDVILREPAEFASAVVAEETGVPHVQVGIGLVSSHRRLMAMAAEAVDGWRAGLMDAIMATPYLTLFPESLEDPDVPPPAGSHRFRDPAADALPGAALPDWWPGDDRPLVYVTFGSQAAGAPMAAPIYGVAAEAIAALEARVLLTTGPMDGAAPQPPGPHVHVTEWVPHADVLPHAALVVCHGGSGTTLGALAAGVPLVFTPLFADQPENAKRVAAAGAGVVVDPREPDAMRSAIDPADLRGAIETVLADGAYAQAAGSIAAEIRALPAAGDAVAVLEAAA